MAIHGNVTKLRAKVDIVAMGLWGLGQPLGGSREQDGSQGSFMPSWNKKPAQSPRALCLQATMQGRNKSLQLTSLLSAAKPTAYSLGLPDKDSASRIHFLVEVVDHTEDIWIRKIRKLDLSDMVLSVNSEDQRGGKAINCYTPWHHHPQEPGKA